MKKRILAMLLAITMMIGMVPVQVFATETEPAETIEEIVETTAAAVETTAEAVETTETVIETTAAATEAAEETTEAATEEVTLPEEPEKETEPAIMVSGSVEAANAAPSGDSIGSVRVIVENTTYTTEEGAPWSGTLVDTQVTLLDDMTMMTAILTALNDKGHTWVGTGADDGDTTGWNITYISSIKKDGTSALSEMDGGSESGWMGTLNDWFVDKGFESWKAGKDLLDGDVIHVMYTQNGYGADIGGGWDNKLGYLSSLSASAGTLGTAFDKDTLAYTLTVPYGTGAVDISAAAENKEDKVTVLVGDTEYRRGENVAVANGTVITINCGETTTEDENGDDIDVPTKTYTITVSVAACEHQWDDATCTAPKTCSICGATEGEANGHSWTDATCIAPKTCSACGETEGEIDADAHDYGEDGICTLCGADKNAPVPFSQSVTIPSNGNSSWGYVSKLVLSGTDGGIYEVYWSSESSPFVADVILTQGTDLDATITATFSTAGMRAPSISGDTSVTLVDGKGTISVTAVSGISAFYPNTEWTINLTVDDGSAANRPTYSITLPDGGEAYTVAAYGSSVSPVIEGRKYSFTVTIPNTYTKEDNFAVKANGVELTASNNVYTIENITEDQVVTVEGVRPKTLAELNVTIIVPEGSIVSTGKFYSYFKYDFDEPLETTTLEDGSIQLIVPVPGSQNFLRVQHPDGVTYWDFDGMSAGSVFKITKEMLHIGDTEFTKDTVYADFEMNIKDKADLYLTVNEKGWLDMATGDTWNLNVFRNFLSLGNSISNNCVALPDTHYKVIAPDGSDSDVVTVTPDANNSCYAEIKAEKPGTAIILVTYDAVYNNDGEGGKQWSALWPENTGVIIVTVDTETADITTNMTVNEEANAGKKQVIDAEHDILFYVGSAGASYSFKPEEGCTVTVNRSTVGSAMTFSGFRSRGVSYAEDGTVTVTGLTTGTHIIKVTKGGKSVYQVVRARQVSYELLHSDGTEVTSDNPAQPGEAVTVQFHNLVSPMEKLSGVYNANFGFWYNGEDGTQIRTSGGTYGVYTFSGNENLQKFTVTIPSYWNDSTYTLTDGAIKIGGFGSSAGAHRTTTYIEGKEVNTNASGVAGALAVLPDIAISTTPCGYNSYNVTLPTGEGYTVTGVGSLPVAEGGSYSFTVAIADGYYSDNLVVKANDVVLTPVEGTYTIENIREDQVVTVEGVAKVPDADMTNATVIFNSSENGTDWGRSGYAYVDTLTLGGAGVASATWDGNNGNVVLSYDTPADAVVGVAIAYAGRNATYAGRMSATLNGAAMTAGETSSVKLADGTATVSINAGYSRYFVTKTITLTVEEVPEDVAETISNVEALIDAIELPVDLDDSDAIKAAWDAYENLTDGQKTMVSNRDILEEARAELENLKAVKLASGKSVVLTSALSGKVTWSLASEYAPYASITKAGKLTAKKVMEKVSVYAVATNAAGTEVDTYRVDIYPAASQVKILDENDVLVNSKTIPVKVNDGSDETLVFHAGTYPEDAMGDVTWTVSDTKGAYVTYEVNGNDITVKAAKTAKKGTVTLTATAKDGSGKKATVKLNIAVLVEDLNVAVKGGTDFTVASGKSITLTAVPTNANATDKAVAWSIVDGADFASITSAGKLTAVKDLMTVQTVKVRAAAKDGSGVVKDISVKVTPLALGVQLYNSGRACGSTTMQVNMTAQKTLELTSRVYPLYKANQSVTWKSSNPKIADVTVDEDGVAEITCLKAGKVTITATADDGSKEKASVTLNIVSGIESLTLGNQVIAAKKSLKLAGKIQINPATATNKSLKWEIVGDAHGAAIDSKGVLSTKKVDVSNGPVELTVRASAQDGFGAEPAECTVTVYPATTKGKMTIRTAEGEAVPKTLEAGKELALEGFCEGAANVYTWKSNNKNVTVKDGVVTASAKAVGKTVTITCTAADGTGVSKTVKIKIVKPTAAE